MNVQRAIQHVLGVSVACVCALTVSGCAWFGHKAGSGCREPAFVADTANSPPLQVPQGLTAPDTRSAIKVPTLDGPERVRAKTEPCLSDPPPYGSDQAQPKALPTLPGAPAPATPAPQ